VVVPAQCAARIAALEQQAHQVDYVLRSIYDILRTKADVEKVMERDELENKLSDAKSKTDAQIQSLATSQAEDMQLVLERVEARPSMKDYDAIAQTVTSKAAEVEQCRMGLQVIVQKVDEVAHSVKSALTLDESVEEPAPLVKQLLSLACVVQGKADRAEVGEDLKEIANTIKTLHEDVQLRALNSEVQAFSAAMQVHADATSKRFDSVAADLEAIGAVSSTRLGALAEDVATQRKACEALDTDVRGELALARTELAALQAGLLQVEATSSESSAQLIALNDAVQLKFKALGDAVQIRALANDVPSLKQFQVLADAINTKASICSVTSQDQFESFCESIQKQLGESATSLSEAIDATSSRVASEAQKKCDAVAEEMQQMLKQKVLQCQEQLSARLGSTEQMVMQQNADYSAQVKDCQAALASQAKMVESAVEGVMREAKGVSQAFACAVKTELCEHINMRTDALRHEVATSSATSKSCAELEEKMSSLSLDVANCAQANSKLTDDLQIVAQAVDGVEKAQEAVEETFTDRLSSLRLEVDHCLKSSEQAAARAEAALTRGQEATRRNDAVETTLAKLARSMELKEKKAASLTKESLGGMVTKDDLTSAYQALQKEFKSSITAIRAELPAAEELRASTDELRNDVNALRSQLPGQKAAAAWARALDLDLAPLSKPGHGAEAASAQSTQVRVRIPEAAAAEVAPATAPGTPGMEPLLKRKRLPATPRGGSTPTVQ